MLTNTAFATFGQKVTSAVHSPAGQAIGLMLVVIIIVWLIWRERYFLWRVTIFLGWAACLLARLAAVIASGMVEIAEIVNAALGGTGIALILAVIVVTVRKLVLLIRTAGRAAPDTDLAEMESETA
jgi:hypothetical protein